MDRWWTGPGGSALVRGVGSGGGPGRCADLGEHALEIDRLSTITALIERLGTTDDLHDLGGDHGLTSSIHLTAELGDQLFGVVGG